MFHQTLIPSSALSSASSSPFLLQPNDAAAAPAPRPPSSPRGSDMPSYANHHSTMDGRMDATKSFGGFPPEETAEDAAAAANAALVEREGFSVEDLLDLEEFGEPDKDAPPLPPPSAAADETEAKKSSPGDSQPSSVVSYELPPPPPPHMVDLPAHDVEEELEWVSRIMDDSLSELPPAPQPLALAAAAQAARSPLHRRPHDGAHRALLPLPPTVCALSTEARVPVKAKRSKRSRSSAWSVPGVGAPLFSDSAASSSTATTSSCSSSGASFSSYFLFDAPPGLEGYHNHHFMPPPPPQPRKAKPGRGGGKPKKRGRKPKHLRPHLAGAAAAAASAASTQGERRCSHCGVQKTPQWRAGPEGAKSLCNACGVRFKSGRLLPEYRPACSPTFVGSIHSNSHRKVLELRRKKEAGVFATAVASF